MLVHHTGKKKNTPNYRVSQYNRVQRFFFFFPVPSRVKTSLIRRRKFTLRWRHHVTHPVITWKTGFSLHTTLIGTTGWCSIWNSCAGCSCCTRSTVCLCHKDKFMRGSGSCSFCRISHGTTANKCKITARHPKCSRGVHLDFADGAADFKAVARRRFKCSLEEQKCTSPSEWGGEGNSPSEVWSNSNFRGRKHQKHATPNSCAFIHKMKKEPLTEE